MLKAKNNTRPFFGITAKVALVLLVTNVLAVALTGSLYYSWYQKHFVALTESHLKSIARQEMQLVQKLVDKHRDYAELLAIQLERRSVWTSQQEATTPLTISPEKLALMNTFKDMMADVSSVSIAATSGEIAYSSQPFQLSLGPSSDELAQVKANTPSVGIFSNSSGDKRLQVITALNIDPSEQYFLIVNVLLNEMSALVNRHIGLGLTEETMLLHRTVSGSVLPVVPLRYGNNYDTTAAINPFAMSEAVRSKISRYKDYRGQDVFAIAQILPDANLAMVFKIDVDDALSVLVEHRLFLAASLVLAVIIALTMSFVFSRRVTLPIKRFIHVARKIADGEVDRRVNIISKDEVALLANSFNTMTDKLVSANQLLDSRVKQKTKDLASTCEKLEKANQDLERISLEDPLTRVANRRCFDKSIYQEWKRAKRDKSEFSIMMLDIDYFKRYNDTLGHLAGDECLRLVANKIQRNIQRENDILARYGGEEFAIILPSTNQEECEQLANKIIDSFRREKIPHPDSPIADFLTLSIGHTTCAPSFQTSITKALEDADNALYVAKEAGRNRSCSGKLVGDGGFQLIAGS